MLFITQFLTQQIASLLAIFHDLEKNPLHQNCRCLLRRSGYQPPLRWLVALLVLCCLTADIFFFLLPFYCFNLS